MFRPGGLEETHEEGPPNLCTNDIDNLLQDEEEIREEVEKLEHDIGINSSAAEWHGVNFGSSFGNSGEFEGRNASTLTVTNKCNECEVSSKTIAEQIKLLTNLDKQLQESHKIQREEKKVSRELKKKLDEAVKLVGDITTENTNIKMDLQVQKDLVMALRLKHNDEPTDHKEDTSSLPDSQQQCDKCKFVSKDRVLMNNHKKRHNNKVTTEQNVKLTIETNPTNNEEGPLPEGERKCDQCNYENKNRVLFTRE